MMSKPIRVHTAALLLVLCSAQALAAEAPPAGDEQQTEDAAAPPAPTLPPPEKADPALFDRALQRYFAGDARQAAPLLYQWLETAPQTEENYAWGQYFLARSLKDLGLTHAAGSYLSRIARERSNPAVLPRALEELKLLTDLPHDEVAIDEQIFGSLDLGFLPEDTGAFAHYQQGLIALKVGNERWAQNHFSRLDETTAEASRAKFALLVTRLRSSKKIDERMLKEFLELSKDPKLTPAMRNEALLAAARLRYERQEWKAALDAYSQVQLPPLDPGQATLYLEEAWTRYQLGELHAAMGLLTTLDAPSFRDEFLPDKYLLRAFVYRDLCHYLPARRAAKELTRRFADSLEAISTRADLTEDLRLRRAAMSSGSTQRAARYLQMLELEGERLGRFAGSLGDRLFTHLVKLYDLSRAEGQRVFDARLRESVRREADKLLRASEQVRLMEYEIGLKLYERIKRGSKLVTPAEEQALKEDQIAFRFGGEYWNDELRSYRFSLQSRCVEDAP